LLPTVIELTIQFFDLKKLDHSKMYSFEVRAVVH